MIDRKEIELLIKAQLKGGRDLTAITKSIADLQDAIERQSEAAKRGERSFDGLKAAQEGLKAVQDELGGRSNALKAIESLNKKIAEQGDRIATTKTKLDAYLKTLTDDRTEKQQARVQTLTASYERAQARLDAFKQSSEKLNAALRESGIDTANLATAQRQIADTSLRVAEAQNRVNKELIDYNANVAKGRAATASLADQQAKLARLQEGNQTDARLARLQAEQKAQQAVADAARKQAEDQAKLSRLVAGNDADARLGRQQAAERQAAADALRKTADAAEATARQYGTLARASQNLRPKVVSLRDALEAMRNPAAASMQTLDGVESAIKGIASTIDAGKGQVADYADQFRNLQTAQRAASTQAGLIDGFRNQLQALRDTRAEFVAARAQVAQYAAAVRQGGEAATQFTKPLAEAQARLRQAAAAMRDQVLATRDSRDALRNAGINSRDLASAQQRLVESTRLSTQAMKQLGDAAEQNSVGVTKAAKGFSLFRDEGRTTLSFVQRLRGEVLALATAYFGIQGAIGLAADSLKAFTQNQGLQSSLAFALGGDPAQVGREIQYVRDQAERLGISFEQASKGYAKFAAAAIKSGASVQETRFIFESFSEVARVINLTPEELNGLFNAIGQSFSKGKIQAEELRQQIGERLPGAFAFAQEALKKDFPDLNKALEEGKVGAENFLLIAESIRRAAGGQLSTAIKNLDAEQQRFNNSVLFFKQQIAEAGFADAYVALLKQITEFFRSDDGKKFAASIGEVAASLANGLSALISWKDELTLLAQVVGALVGGALMAKFGAQITVVAAGLSTALTGMTLLTPVVLSLSGGLAGLLLAVTKLLAPLTAVGLAAFALGSYLYDSSAAVRVFGANLVAYMMSAIVTVKAAFQELFFDMPRVAANGLKAVVNVINTFLVDVLRLFPAALNLIIGNNLGGAIFKALDGLQQKLTLRYDNGASGRVKKVQDQLLRDLAEIENLRQAQVDAQTGTFNPNQKSVRDRSDSRFFRDRPLQKRPNSLAGDAAATKKLQTEIDSIGKALDELDAKTQKKQGESLDAQLKAVDLQYKDLGERIAKIGGTTGKQFAERFAQAVTDLKTEIAKDFNDKLLAEQTALQRKLEQLEVQAGRKQKDDLQARLNAVQTAQEQTYRDIAALQTRLVQAGQPTDAADEMKRRVDAAVLELQNIERQKTAREQLTTLEKQYNETIKVRDELIAAVRAQQDVGAIDDVQAAQQINAITQDSLPKILAAAQATRDWAEAYFAIFGGDPTEATLFLAGLDATIAKVRQVRTEFNKLEQAAITGAIQAIDTGLNAMYDNLIKVVDGQQSLADGFKNAGVEFLRFAAQFLREIAMMIVKQAIFNALKNSGNIYLQAIGAAGSASVKHSGGVVGSYSSNRTRAVDPAWFANAPRYKTGGIAGLAPDEYATILHKNEEVLKESDPRNILNGGGMRPAGDAGRGLKVVLVDDTKRVPEAMNSAEGDEVILMSVKRNLPTIRQMVRG